MKHLFAAMLVLLSVSAASAQPTVPVLGVGSVTFDMPVDIVAAQALTYRAYLGTTPAIKLTVTCVAVATTSGSTCTFPLSALPLTSVGQPLALTSVVAAADGELESAKAAVPFVLAKALPPVAPTGSSARIRAAP